MPKITKLHLHLLKLCKENCGLFFPGHSVDIKTRKLRCNLEFHSSAALLMTSASYVGYCSLGDTYTLFPHGGRNVYNMNRKRKNITHNIERNTVHRKKTKLKTLKG